MGCQYKVVFVGSAKQLKKLNMSYFFALNNWQVFKCEDIASAKKQKPDILVVYAYGQNHVDDFNQWPDHPPTVWFCFARQDIVPPGAKKMLAIKLPSQLYLECVALLNSPNSSQA